MCVPVSITRRVCEEGGEQKSGEGKQEAAVAVVNDCLDIDIQTNHYVLPSYCQL